MYKIYTDGSCLDNNAPSRYPRRGGYAAVLTEDGKKIEDFSAPEYDYGVTNNTMEMRAIKAALLMATDNSSEYTIYSDSMYCVDCINTYIPKWKAKGWTKRGGIANLSLWKEIYSIWESKPNVKLEWVKAHVGIEWNEYVDKLAGEQALRSKDEYEDNN